MHVKPIVWKYNSKGWAVTFTTWNGSVLNNASRVYATWELALQAACRWVKDNAR